MKTRIFAIIAFFSLSAPLTAQDKYTYSQCLELARGASEDLKMQSEKIIQAEQRIAQSRGTLLPSLDFVAVKTYQDTAGGEFQNDLTDTKFTLNQSLFSGLSGWHGLGAAKGEARKERLLYTAARRELNAAVAVAFYALAQIEADAANLDESLKLMIDRRDELVERARLGKSRDSEVLQLESQIAALKAQQSQVSGSMASALETLSYLTGVDSSSLEIDDGAPAAQDPGPVGRYLDGALKRSDIEALKQDVVTEQYRAKAVKGGLLPSLDLNGAYYTARSGSSADSKWTAYLTLDVPLFQGGSAWARAREENSKLRQAEFKLAQSQRLLGAQVKSLYKSLLSSIEQEDAYRDAYLKAQKSYQAQLRDYRFGLVNNLDVTQAMLSMIDAKRSYDRSVIQAKVNKAALDIAVEE